MKKRNVLLQIMLSLSIISGCNEGNINSNSNTSSKNSIISSENNSSSVDDGIIPEGAYEVKVLLPDGAHAGEGISVQWCSNETCYDSKTNSEGIAYKVLEPGNYDVKLSGYDKKYSYQFGQKSTAENRKLEIKLQDVLTASPKEDGENAPEAGTIGNPYIVGEGVYTTTIKSEGNIQYYEFTPNRLGKYIIESWGTSSELIIADPFINYYGTDKNANEIVKSDDNSGYYDVNFALELDITSLEEAHIFGVSATSVRSKKTFPFVIKWIEEVSN